MIAEELLLLAYSEEEGKPLVSGTQVDTALGGAVLAELAILGRVSLEGKKVVLQDSTPVGDDELDSALTKIAESRTERKPDWWVYKFYTSKLRQRLLTRLAERGVLSEERVKVLGFIPLNRYPERDPSIEQAVRARVTDVLGGAEPDERVAVLLSLLKACRLDRKAFPDADKQRIKEITEGEWAGAAVKKTIDSINAVVIVTVTTGVIVGTAGGGS
ncbi:GOLPH3/VPS74 family protein [Sinosporangium album]|nr:GPP34 family phosphoprotein [Sinosporangium album]